MIELIAGSIKLREFFETDKSQLATLCNNKKIWDNVRDSLPYPYTEKDAIDYIRLCQKESPKITFAIEKNGVLAGTIGLLKKTDVDRLTAEIGYWLGEPFWGQGIATEAVKLITQYGFDKLGLVRIHTGVFDFNKPSMRVLLKAGYHLDGVFKQSVYKNGKIIDEYWFSKLKDDKQN